MTPSTPQRHLYLFCEDAALEMEIHNIVTKTDIRLTRQTKLKLLPPAEEAAERAFLVHLHPGKIWPTAIIEQLLRESRIASLQILLITEGLADVTTIQLIKRGNLRGYLPRIGLLSALKQRLELLFNANESLRKRERINVQMPVRYTIGSQTYEGLCTSFSEAGMFVQTQKPPKQDSGIDVTLYLPKSKRVEHLKARTLYVIPMGFAATFPSPLPQCLQELKP